MHGFHSPFQEDSWKVLLFRQVFAIFPASSYQVNQDAVWYGMRES